MLFRLAYLAVTNTFAALRLLPMGARDKDVEILVLRHQITVLERQLGAGTRVRFAPEDRVFLAALLTSLPREVLCRLRLLVRPDTVLRWHRDLMRRRHARTCQSKRPGRPPTVRSIRTLILRLVRENPVGSDLRQRRRYRRYRTRKHTPPGAVRESRHGLIVLGGRVRGQEVRLALSRPTQARLIVEWPNGKAG
ncbi:hypothetical protein GCM10018965_038050 [Nonomuraea roseola]